MLDVLTVRFRVNNVYKDMYLSVYYDTNRVLHRKMIILTPGEMEQIMIKKEELLLQKHLSTITICLEKE